jgi:hypothetical protein
MLNEEGQWSSVREEWASERERLASAREEWEVKAKVVESSLGSATAKVDTGLASLALLQHQNGLGNGDVTVFHGTSSGLVTPPSPRSLSADLNRPRQCRKTREIVVGTEDKVEQCQYAAVITRVEENLANELTGGWKVIEVCSLDLVHCKSSMLTATFFLPQIGCRSARAYVGTHEEAVNILKDGINPVSEHEQRGERASEDRLLITLYPA